MLGGHRPRAGVQQEEVAGAVGVLGLPGGEADLSDGGGVLVAEVRGQRDLAVQRPGDGGRAVAGRVGRRPDRREYRPRDAEELQQLVVPVEGVQVHQHGAAGVGDVRHVQPAARPAGEVPQQPAVHGAEDGLAPFGRGADPVDVVENPRDLARGEVGRRWQAGPAPDHLAAAVALQRGHDPVGAGVLPDDRVVVWPAGARVPHDRGLALVGDAERGQVRGAEAGVGQGRRDDGGRALPDLHRVVLDPARARQDLGVFELAAGDLAAIMIENHETGACGALVDRPDEIAHRRPSVPCGRRMWRPRPSGWARPAAAFTGVMTTGSSDRWK